MTSFYVGELTELQFGSSMETKTPVAGRLFLLLQT
jgi:hypothetical protein